MELPNMNYIYTLKHGQVGILDGWEITRVPGGWIFYKSSKYSGTADVGVFIPFNNEFQDN